MKAFSLNEMETIFEIGRIIQMYDCENLIEIADSKDAFNFALQLAIEFEDTHQDTDNFYGDLYEFVAGDIVQRFPINNK